MHKDLQQEWLAYKFQSPQLIWYRKLWWQFKLYYKEYYKRYNDFCYPIDRIPEGFYCYTYDENGKYYTCPYHEFVDGHHYQENGYCKKTGIKDWEETHLSLLWDLCKECGIKMDGASYYDSQKQKLIQIDEETGKKIIVPSSSLKII